jgi:hypothetical protein
VNLTNLKTKCIKIKSKQFKKIKKIKKEKEIKKKRKEMKAMTLEEKRAIAYLYQQ